MNQKHYSCKLKGKTRLMNIEFTNPIAVGDYVEFSFDNQNQIGIIEKINTRKNYIIRKSVNLSHKSQVIASNIDLALLIVTIQDPITSLNFIDRFLVQAEAYGIKSKLQPFKNIELLDIGCGGGLLSEPLCRLGANITAIDASLKNIEVAKYHARKNKLNIKYICSSPDKFKPKKKYDVVLNMEIIEHVEDINLFLKKSSQLIKKNGLMFVATLNKTLKSYIFAIVGAEYILRWLPIGTHDWDKFVTPNDLIQTSKKIILN